MSTNQLSPPRPKYSPTAPSESDDDDDDDGKQEEDDGKKWWAKTETTAEYEADIDIPLVMTGTDVMVEDTQDVYAMPVRSPKKKDEPATTYYNFDPSPAASPSSIKKKSKKKKKSEARPSVMVEDTQDVYSIPDKS